MSIFQETIRDFVAKQLKIRERILSKGNKGDSRFASFSPREKINTVGALEETITIDAGAFYTNTVSRQCVIRMCSGVDLKDEKTTTDVILEGGRYEKKKDLVKEGLAIRYILEGGIPTKDKDFVKDKKGSTRTRDITRVIPRGRGRNRGFGKSYGSPYGDPYLRSDAKDGFGIVPMPGIIDATIRTKSAYGSLREAQVNFTCHNRRQLEILELLYMRPGYPILLEWGWAPYINNKGKRENNFPGYIDKFFEQGISTNFINSLIVKRKKTSGGNYDGFLGFCKNFQIKSRPDGGYDCTTEIIAMGECLAGLKGKRTGLTLKNTNNENILVDDFEFLLQSLRSVSILQGGTTGMSTEQKIVNHFIDPNLGKSQARLNVNKLAKYLKHYGIIQGDTTEATEITGDTGYSNEDFKDENLVVIGYIESQDLPIKVKGLPAKEGTIYEGHGISLQNGVQLVRISNNAEGVEFKAYRGQYLTLEEFQEKFGTSIQAAENVSADLKATLADFIIFENDKLTNEILTKERWLAKDKIYSSASTDDYIRWDFLVNLLNKCVIESYQEDGKNTQAISEFTCLRDPISSQTKLSYINYIDYQFSDDLAKKFKFKTQQETVEERDGGTVTKLGQPINIEELIDASIDPSICLLPHQIPEVVNKRINKYNEAGAVRVTNKSVGFIYLNLAHLTRVFYSMRYNEGGVNDEFNILDYIKKIWEQDVNDACAGTHNFIVGTEIERPNVARIIDMQADTSGIEPDDLFEFDIQSNETIVRDFNFNTTIPSSLSATIAVAAQSARSVSNIDQVSFAKFNKYTENRFAREPVKFKDKTESQKQAEADAKKSKAKAYDDEVARLKRTVEQLLIYREFLLFGKNKDVNDEGKSVATMHEAKGYVKALEGQIISVLSKYSKSGKNSKGESFSKGEFKPVQGSGGKSAVIPLKFNAIMDGIGGLVIGNVFKVKKDKLPKGYQADDIAFAIMGENQKITAGQDWTTEFNGQLLLLDLEEEKGSDSNTENETNEISEEETVTNNQELNSEQKEALDNLKEALEVQEEKAKEIANEYAKLAFYYNLGQRFISAGFLPERRVIEGNPEDYNNKAREYKRLTEFKQTIMREAAIALDDGEISSVYQYKDGFGGDYVPEVEAGVGGGKGNIELRQEELDRYFRSYWGSSAQKTGVDANGQLAKINSDYSEEERTVGIKYFFDNRPIRIRDGSGNVIDVNDPIPVTQEMLNEQAILTTQLTSPALWEGAEVIG